MYATYRVATTRTHRERTMTQTDARKRRGWRAVLAVGLGLSLALAACGGPESTLNTDGGADAAGGTETTDPEGVGSTDGGEITAGISYALSTGFDPLTTSAAVTLAANIHIFEGLVELDPVTREPYAALATDLPQQIDETTWQATLRDGAIFHDGSDVTIDDVVFSFERVLDPEVDTFYTGFVNFIESVQAVDESTVQFDLAHPFALLPERLSVVKIVPQALVEEDPEGFDANPVGTGPFALVDAIRDDRITFERHEGYNGPRPAQVDQMTWLLLSDASARVTALESGRVQAIEDLPYIDIDRVSGQFEVDSVDSFGVLFMMFNTDAEPFDDVRVRQALHYAINDERLIETAFLGNATPASSFVHETHPNYQEAATVYAYDPERARELLEEAGVTDLSVTLVTTDTGWVADAAPIIQESWEAIGVSTDLDIGQSGGQYADKIDPGNYQVMVAPGDPSVFGNDLDLLIRWWYDGLWPETRFRWADTAEFAQLHELLDAAVRADDEAEQQELWGEAMDLLAEEVPLYPILHRSLPTAWNADELDGFRPLPTTGLSFLDVGRR
jgi:peptide/nickel transport system substrate-binding protein